MISPLRLTTCIAALGVLSLTACAAESVTAPAPAPSAPRVADAPARDVCTGYSVADGKC